MQAAPFKGTGKQASIALAIELDAAGLQFSHQPNQTFTDGVELALFALDERGRQQGGSFIISTTWHCVLRRMTWFARIARIDCAHEPTD